MSAYYFRFHECDGSVRDMADAIDARTLGDAREIAVGLAREIMASEVRNGRLCLSCWIVIVDEHGHNLDTLQFGDAIEFKAEPACGHESREHAEAHPSGDAEGEVA